MTISDQAYAAIARAPERTSWVAQDRWGRWTAFNVKPKANDDGSWNMQGAGTWVSWSADLGVTEPVADWKSTLTPVNAWRPA